MQFGGCQTEWLLRPVSIVAIPWLSISAGSRSTFPPKARSVRTTASVVAKLLQDRAFNKASITAAPVRIASQSSCSRVAVRTDLARTRSAVVELNRRPNL